MQSDAAQIRGALGGQPGDGVPESGGRFVAGRVQAHEAGRRPQRAKLSLLEKRRQGARGATNKRISAEWSCEKHAFWGVAMRRAGVCVSSRAPLYVCVRITLGGSSERGEPRSGRGRPQKVRLSPRP